MQHVELPFQAERPRDFPLDPGIRSEKRGPIFVPQDGLEEREPGDQQPENTERRRRLRRTKKTDYSSSGALTERLTIRALFLGRPAHSGAMTKLEV